MAGKVHEDVGKARGLARAGVLSEPMGDTALSGDTFDGNLIK